MKKVIYTTLLVTISLSLYIYGYYNGVHDGIYMEHAIVGKLAVMESERCNESNELKKCFNNNALFNTSVGVFHHNSHENKVSVLAQYLFPEMYKAKNGAIDYYHTLINNNSVDYLCENYKTDVKEHYDDCVKELKAFNEHQ